MKINWMLLYEPILTKSLLQIFIYCIIGLCWSWLTMDDDNLSVTCPGCLLGLSSTSCGCRDQCESGNLHCIGCICALTLVCWLLFPFCRLASLLLLLSASFLPVCSYLWSVLLQLVWSVVRSSQELMLMLSAFMSLLHAPLYLSCGWPVLLCPEVSSP